MMKKKYALPLLFINVIVILGLGSCGKVVERKLIKGTYELTDFKLDTLSRNFMEVALYGYQSNSDCCRYEIDFNDNGTCTGTYFIQDTINYSVTGTWDLPERLVLDIQLDRYVDGVYNIERHNRRDYTLTTDKNTAIGNVVKPAVLTIKRTDI